jgi:hypothetical protein
MLNILYFYWILMKLEFYRQFFEKSSNVKFHECPSSRRRVVPLCQTDEQTGMTSLSLFTMLQTPLTTATIRQYSKPIECFAKSALSFDGKIYAIHTKCNIYMNNTLVLISTLPFAVS